MLDTKTKIRILLERYAGVLLLLFEESHVALCPFVLWAGDSFEIIYRLVGWHLEPGQWELDGGSLGRRFVDPGTIISNCDAGRLIEASMSGKIRIDPREAPDARAIEARCRLILECIPPPVDMAIVLILKGEEELHP